MTTLRWILSPAVEDVPRRQAFASAALRILVGLLWLYNVSWKRPPDFGQDSGKSVFGFTKDAVDHPVFPPFSWLVEHVVLPNFTVFGWSVLIIETALAVALLTGAYVRLAALIGIAQSLAIGLSVAQTPGEWPWSYWLMIGVHVALLFSAAGTVLAVDALRSDPERASRDSSGRPLALGWGAVVSVAGLIALIMSIGDDPLDSSGARLGGPGLSIGLGSYNILGSALLLVCGVTLLVAALTRTHPPALAAAVVGAGAAIVLYAQSATSDSVLGGTNTSAAFFVSVAVVGAAVWGIGRDGPVEPRSGPNRTRAET